MCRCVDFYFWVYGMCVCVCVCVCARVCVGEWACGISGLENHQLTNLCPFHPSALKQCRNFHKNLLIALQGQEASLALFHRWVN